MSTLEYGSPSTPRPQRPPRLAPHSWVLFVLAHVIVCYSLVGLLALTRPGASDPPDSPEESDEEDYWFMKEPWMSGVAPITVPIIVGGLVAMAFSWPAEGPPLIAGGVALIYLAATGVCYQGLRWLKQLREQRRASRTSPAPPP